MYSPEADARAEARLRVMRILWIAFLASVGLYALVAYLANPLSDAERARIQGDPAPTGIPAVLVALFALGVALVVASFVLKQAFAKKAAARQLPDAFQTGFILALAFCESAALFGLVGLFVTGSRYAYALLALGALAIALHFPRREQLLAAYFKPAG